MPPLSLWVFWYLHAVQISELFILLNRSPHLNNWQPPPPPCPHIRVGDEPDDGAHFREEVPHGFQNKNPKALLGSFKIKVIIIFFSFFLKIPCRHVTCFKTQKNPENSSLHLVKLIQTSGNWFVYCFAVDNDWILNFGWMVPLIPGVNSLYWQWCSIQILYKFLSTNSTLWKYSVARKSPALKMLQHASQETVFKLSPVTVILLCII